MGKYNINFGKSVQIIKVIRTTIGKDEDGKSLVQYWDLNGTPLVSEFIHLDNKEEKTQYQYNLE